MNHHELKGRIDDFIHALAQEMPKAKTDEEANLARLIHLGMAIVGEVILDFKRIADASGQVYHIHPPTGSSLVQEGSVIMVRPGDPADWKPIPPQL